ncbi:MAG: AmmeMemoRadiSam system protein A [Deltaproteobacteria bacterium]|nr:AmmeMemoRadiSam system protein A [Deltaproteobacteria bacterium]
MSEQLSPLERAALLGVARAAIRHRLGLGPAPAVPESGALGDRRGAFVTLHRGGELRGCIGRFDPESSLARTVAEMAVAAAFEDPRFPPLRPEEADDLDLHISALGPRRPLPDPAQLRVGQHGLAVQQGWHRGVLLPVVAVERGWDAPTFLKHACLKAGLRPDAWQDPATTIEVFDAEEFGEPAGENP